MERSELKEMEAEPKQIDEQINNIINAISNGFYQEEFKVKMEGLKERKTKLEINICQVKVKTEVPKLTEEQIKGLFSMFKKFVLERNLPECKRIIHDYVKEVVVYKDHIEVIFNVASLVFGGDAELQVTSSIRKVDLFKAYSKSLC